MEEQLQQKIKIYYHDELRDEKKYKEIAEDLCEQYPKYAKIFIDLANEEKSHSVIINRIIKELNI